MLLFSLNIEAYLGDPNIELVFFLELLALISTETFGSWWVVSHLFSTFLTVGHLIDMGVDSFCISLFNCAKELT
jgi:hypothetical protein